MMLEVGTKVHDFALKDAYGKLHHLSDYQGKKIVLYFYPKDNTPGCSVQACAFRDAYDQFRRNDIVVIGISKDSAQSHLKFIKNYDLPFILLSDETAEVATYFGVYVQKKMFGHSYMGYARTTFVLDESMIITHVFKKASPSKNAQDILKILNSL